MAFMGSTLSGKEVIPSISLEDVAAFCDTEVRRFCKKRLCE